MTALDPSPTALRQALLADREQALTQLYRRAFPLVRRHVRRHGGSAEDAQDVFQEALVVLYERAVGGTLDLTAPASAYLLGTARHLWQHEQRRRARLPTAPLADNSPDDLPGHAEEDLAAEPAGPGPEDLLAYVAQLGERCRGLLLAFYYFEQPLAQIAHAFDYRSVRSATVQKFKCLERLRHAVRAAFTPDAVAR